MFIRAKKNTKVIDFNNRTIDLKAWEVVKTTQSLYRQYMSSDVIENISHSFDSSGIVEIYRVQALMDVALYTLVWLTKLKKWEQAVITRREMENFVRMWYVEVIIFVIDTEVDTEITDTEPKKKSISKKK